MKTEIERELKSIISKEKYGELVLFFEKIAENQGKYEQVNYYFDSENGLLKNEKITLRLRHKKGKWQITAKVKIADGDISVNREYNENISEEEANNILKDGLTDKFKVIKELNVLLSKKGEKYKSIGNLKTERIDFAFYSDVISLDISHYNGVTDYELEWETNNEKFARQIFKDLNITHEKVISKKERFMNTI